MSLDTLNKKVDALREEADLLKRTYIKQRETILSDRSLSDEGKKELLTARLKEVNARRAQLEAEEVKALDAEVQSARGSLTMRTGGKTYDPIAERNADDRADRLASESEAVKVVERSLANDDRSLTQAVLRRAINDGWDEAIAVIGTKYPLAVEAVETIQAIEQHRENPTETMTRTITYASVNEFGS
ncbi:hypothetical protein [Microbacterium sp. K41]|uniref:hypothetical protein n=1 Tax=Microbacterium sp. K41 TaxID=2305437 RepID=UPI00109C7ED9|nr:hypothetical protein [Microbacterium sp. K41]